MIIALFALLFSSLGAVLSKMLKGHVTKPDLSSAIGLSIALCGLISVPLDAYVTGMEMDDLRGESEQTFNNFTTKLFPGKKGV